MWIDDQILAGHESPLVTNVWVPELKMVVLGSSNHVDTECHVVSCQEDAVPILRRYGGGGTVVLYPGCVVVSVGCWVARHFENERYFRKINAAINHCLHSNLKITAALGQNGISDLVAGDRKYGGTSLFRSRNYLLYQASLIVDCDRGMIARYLAHPSREPGYRRGRDHKSFLVGLAEVAGEPLLVSDCKTLLSTQLAGYLAQELGDDLIAPCREQFPAMVARLERANAARDTR